jgi:mono/diheme cytochrome c family protein
MFSNIGRQKMHHKLLYLVSFLVLLGCAGVPKVSDMEIQEAMKLKRDPAHGKLIYEKECVFCHREKGEGGGVAVGKLERAQSKRDEDLYRSIKEGAGTWMPAFSKMTAEDTMDVIQYIRELFLQKGG